MAEYDIFISYRRVGGADFARQMQLALKNKGYNVFLDFDALKDGVFDRRIEAAIKSSKVFLFILSLSPFFAVFSAGLRSGTARHSSAPAPGEDTSWIPPPGKR